MIQSPQLREMKTTIDTKPPPEMPMSHRREIERVQFIDIFGYNFLRNTFFLRVAAAKRKSCGT